MKIFLNETPFDVPDGTTVRDAVAQFDPHLADHLAGGGAFVTDGVGREMPIDSMTFNGAIYRVVVSARTPREGEADG